MAKITDQKKFSENVNDIDTNGLKPSGYPNCVEGTISIDIAGEGWRDITGQHGFNDYEEDFGFRITYDIFDYPVEQQSCIQV